MEVWVREIHLRACVRIGELSWKLDKAVHGGAGGGTLILLKDDIQNLS
jgi:hypothetical protein